ncbi:MAG TPA: type II secretion system protein [Gemmatimonadales bacterium]|jgi:prepilin-type N-terminal cleavage/methylation domain-containing protein
MQRRDNGFTLIELLWVIVIIGILAGLALPKYAATKEKALTARMVSDLRNMAVSEEAYFNDFSLYYGGPVPAPALIFSPSKGVTVEIDESSETGWSATAASEGTSKQCMIFLGTAAPVGEATVEGKPACTP